MNKKAELYWNQFWKEKEKPLSVTAWQFGFEPDELAQLVIDGIKTATCSSYLAYQIENESIPAVDDYSIILNSHDDPVAIIRTAAVQVMPFSEVPESFAIAEGEGDISYVYWRKSHEVFFKNELATMGKKFSEEMLVVCERFELIDVKI